MAIWYRVSPDKNSQNTFSGDGGLYVAGRWHNLGKKVIYCSESIALCTLEWLAHNGLSISGFNYYRYAINVPDNLIVRFSPSELPEDWNATPSTDSTRDFAEKNLFFTNKFLAMAIPSVIVPEEYNLVVNPSHSAFCEITNTIQVLGQYIAPNR